MLRRHLGLKRSTRPLKYNPIECLWSCYLFQCLLILHCCQNLKAGVWLMSLILKQKMTYLCSGIMRNPANQVWQYLNQSTLNDFQKPDWSLFMDRSSPINTTVVVYNLQSPICCSEYLQEAEAA